jgi:hypothetical protein
MSNKKYNKRLRKKFEKTKKVPKKIVNIKGSKGSKCRITKKSCLFLNKKTSKSRFTKKAFILKKHIKNYYSLGGTKGEGEEEEEKEEKEEEKKNEDEIYLDDIPLILEDAANESNKNMMNDKKDIDDKILLDFREDYDSNKKTIIVHIIIYVGDEFSTYQNLLQKEYEFENTSEIEYRKIIYKYGNNDNFKELQELIENSSKYYLLIYSCLIDVYTDFNKDKGKDESEKYEFGKLLELNVKFFEYYKNFLESFKNESFKNVSILHNTNGYDEFLYISEIVKLAGVPINYLNDQDKERLSKYKPTPYEEKMGKKYFSIYSDLDTSIRNMYREKSLYIEDINYFYKVLNFHVSDNQDNDKNKTYYDTSKGNFVNINYEDKDLTQLTETWWFKRYFSIPPCARGRLTQTTGTCWFNACINLLLISPIFKNLLINLYKDTEKEDPKFIKRVNKIRFKDYYTVDINIDEIFFSLIKILLIDRNKALYLDEDFVAAIASRVKCLTEEILNSKNISLGFEKKCEEFFSIESEKYNKNDIKIGEAYSSNLSFPIILLIIFQQDYYNSIFLDAFYDCDIENRKILFEFFKNGNEKNLTTNLEEQSILLKPIIIFNFYDLDKHIEVNKYRAPENIYIYGKSYILHGAIMYVRTKTGGGHAICGFVCGGKKYVYDSNNYISDDNWNEGNIDEYIKKTEYIYTYEGFVLLIYIRSDILENKMV